MSSIIGISIDLKKINKAKIKEGKNGQMYYDLTVLVNDKPDKYGKDVAVIEPQSKEERDAKADRTYLGNGKVLWPTRRNEDESQERPEDRQERKPAPKSKANGGKKGESYI